MSEETALETTEDRKPVKIRPITDSRVKLNRGGQANNEWFVTAEANTPVESVFDPSFWAHVAERMRPYDIVVVAVDDEAWFLQAIVRSTMPQSVFLKALPGYPMPLEESLDMTFADQYEVKWRGPHALWSVMRLSDNKPVAEKMQSREAAHRWLTQNGRSLLN